MNFLKKMLNVFLIIIGIVLIVLCIDVVSNKLTNNTFDDLSSLDREALEEICEIDSLFDSRKGNDDIWDIKYNLADVGCVISRKYGLLKGYSYAVNVDFSSNIFAQKIEMPNEYDDISVYRFSFLAPQTLALMTSKNDEEYISIGGENLYSVKYSTSSVKYNGSGSLEEAYVKSTFEAAVETEDCPAAEVSVSYDLSEENIALTGLQYRIIDDMLHAKNIDDLNELIAEYVIVREYQSEKYPEFANQQERIELVDGRSQHVFYKISSMIHHDITYFNKDKADAITFYSAYYYLCTGRYNSDVSEYFDYTGNIYVGAALCEIIDENGLCANWEKKLDNSTNSDFTSEYTIIKNYCGGACGDYSDKTVEDIMEEYGYDEILNMAKALVEGNE